LQKKCGRIGVLAFDLDGVLVKHPSSWRYLHERFGSIRIVQERNDSEMFRKGIITYSEWMERDLKALLQARGNRLRRSEIVEAFRECEIEDHAEELVHYVKSLGIAVAIVSGGIDILANMVAEKLGIELVYANKLVFDERDYLIPRGVEVVNPLRKDEVLKKISKITSVPLSKFMYVGDSDWDSSAFRAVGYPVLYVRKGEARPAGISNTYIVGNMLELKNLISRLC